MAKQALAALVTITLLLACFPREARCEESSDVRASLVAFLVELAGGDPQLARDLRWDATVQPCDPTAPWTGVTCSGNNDGRVRTIVLENQGPGKLTGTLNATLLCAASTLRVLSLQGNAVRGGLEDGVAACRALTHLYLAGNRLSGALPPALARLRDLHVVDVAGNGFSGAIPVGLAGIGLKTFLANDNTFSGAVPDFDLRGFEKFSVANNSLTGPIPKNVGKFGDARFFLPNAAGICGQPVLPACQQSSFPSPSPGTDSDFGAAPPPSTGSNSTGDKGRSKRTKVLMYVGYALLGAVILALVTYLCVKKRRSKLQRKFKQGGGRRVTDSSRVTTATTSVISASKSVYSIPTSVVQSPAAAATGLAAASAPSPSLVVLRRSGTAASITSAAAAAAAKELRFEDLLKSPAELLGRGRFGSSYKVVVPGGAELAVKRVKDGAVGEGEFRRRMERVGRARHAAVLPPLAFYCAMQEKLVVYEFQTNGSLERLLHGSIESSQGPVDWPTRLHIAAKVAEGMAFMHATLRGDGINSTDNSISNSSDEAAAADGPIAHGNLKTSNILFTAGMDPCISEYGVTTGPHQLPVTGGAAALQADVRAFGVVLLELLTGKATVAQGDGAELARWVAAVIREEWTAEVFDRALLDGSNEQRMVRLLQVAMRCVDASPGAAPPTMREVSSMINAIREEDDRSISSEA